MVNSSTTFAKLTPRVRLVISRTRFLNRSTALGAMRRFGSACLVKLKPRNFRSCGLATTLFSLFTLSLSGSVMNCTTLSITRQPDAAIETASAVDPLEALKRAVDLLNKLKPAPAPVAAAQPQQSGISQVR